MNDVQKRNTLIALCNRKIIASAKAFEDFAQAVKRIGNGAEPSDLADACEQRKHAEQVEVYKEP